jgi:hypothetical protein
VPLAMTFSCGMLGNPNMICFPVPPGIPVHVEITYWCADPYVGNQVISRTIPAADDGALEWSWRPPTACHSGGANILLRASGGGGDAELRGTIGIGFP